MHKDDTTIISKIRQMTNDMPDGISVTISEQGNYRSFDAKNERSTRKPQELPFYFRRGARRAG